MSHNKLHKSAKLEKIFFFSSCKSLDLLLFTFYFVYMHTSDSEETIKKLINYVNYLEKKNINDKKKETS